MAHRQLLSTAMQTSTNINWALHDFTMALNYHINLQSSVVLSPLYGWRNEAWWGSQSVLSHATMKWQGLALMTKFVCFHNPQTCVTLRSGQPRGHRRNIRMGGKKKPPTTAFSAKKDRVRVMNLTNHVIKEGETWWKIIDLIIRKSCIHLFFHSTNVH